MWRVDGLVYELLHEAQSTVAGSRCRGSRSRMGQEAAREVKSLPVRMPIGDGRSWRRLHGFRRQSTAGYQRHAKAEDRAGVTPALAPQLLPKPHARGLRSSGLGTKPHVEGYPHARDPAAQARSQALGVLAPRWLLCQRALVQRKGQLSDAAWCKSLETGLQVALPAPA